MGLLRDKVGGKGLDLLHSMGIGHAPASGMISAPSPTTVLNPVLGAGHALDPAAFSRRFMP